jgi:hypothetical protein
MGKELIKIFQIVEEKAGNNGRLKLSQQSKISRLMAEQMTDEPEIIKSLKKIASELINTDIEKYL